MTARLRSRSFLARGLAGLLVPAALLLAPAARAASCTVSAPTFSFPNYNTLSNIPDEGFASIGLNCALSMGEASSDVSYVISLSPGTSGTYTARTFIGQPLQYNLYTNPNHTLVWGDGTAGTETVAGTLALPGNANAMHSVYGLIPARQQVEPGTVSDRVVVIVDY